MTKRPRGGVVTNTLSCTNYTYNLNVVYCSVIGQLSIPEIAILHAWFLNETVLRSLCNICLCKKIAYDLYTCIDYLFSGTNVRYNTSLFEWYTVSHIFLITTISLLLTIRPHFQLFGHKLDSLLWILQRVHTNLKGPDTDKALNKMCARS